MRFLYGDPEELDRLANRLRSQADAVRYHAEDQVRRAAAANWVSTAAQAFRDELARKRRDADRAAESLEQAATALQTHAQEVRQLVARIARIEQDVTDWFSRKAHEVVDAVGSVVRRIAHGDLPWSGWPYTPQSLPPPGDKDWLHVGDFMRRQGVL
jgi:ABC-type transporter Mla subunit MlaD